MELGNQGRAAVRSRSELALVHVLELQDPANLVGMSWSTRLLQFCQHQPLYRTEPAAPAGSEHAKRTFRDHMFKGSVEHRALGGFVLYKGQVLREGKRDVTMNECHSKQQ